MQNEINVIYLCIMFFFVIIKIKKIVMHEIRTFNENQFLLFFFETENI